MRIVKVLIYLLISVFLLAGCVDKGSDPSVGSYNINVVVDNNYPTKYPFFYLGADYYNGKWQFAWGETEQVPGDDIRRFYTGYCDLDGSNPVVFERANATSSLGLAHQVIAYNGRVFAISEAGSFGSWGYYGSFKKLRVASYNPDGSDYTVLYEGSPSIKPNTTGPQKWAAIVDGVIYIFIPCDGPADSLGLITMNTDGTGYAEQILSGNIPYNGVKVFPHNGRVYFTFREGYTDIILGSVNTDPDDLDLQITTVYSDYDGDIGVPDFYIYNDVVCYAFSYYGYDPETSQMRFAMSGLDGSGFTDTVALDYPTSTGYWYPVIADIIQNGDKIIFFLGEVEYDSEWNAVFNGAGYVELDIVTGLHSHIRLSPINQPADRPDSYISEAKVIVSNSRLYFLHNANSGTSSNEMWCGAEGASTLFANAEVFDWHQSAMSMCSMVGINIP